VNPVSTIKKLRLLLIEDNAGDARLLRERLGDTAGIRFELEVVGTLAAGLARLDAESFDLVLLDMSLPDSAGLDTFKTVHTHTPEVPIIVLSGLDDEAVAVQTVHEGAQDYLVKADLDHRLLVRSIRYAIERKRTEEALARERDLFHTLMDNIPDRIYFKDTESRFFRINRAVAAQFQIKHPSEAVGRTDGDFFTPEHAENALADERWVIQQGQPLLGKVERDTLPDGSVTWALTSKLPLKDKQGRIVGVFGVSRDITALKKAETELQAERNLLRSLIDNLPDYIFVKDTACRYLLDNIAHRRLVGVSTPQEVEGRTAADLFPPDVAEQLTHDDLGVMSTGHPLLNKEELVTDRCGNRRWHVTTKVPLRDQEGQIAGLVGIGRDITERKNSEEQLQRNNIELARHRSELQHALDDLRQAHEQLKTAQDQLIQAEKMQSIGRLAAGVAHEVKNPLSVLRMGVDYFQRNLSTPDPNVATILRDMSDSIDRANSIIMGLLDFSVPYALDSRNENLSAIVRQSLNLVRYAFGESETPIRLATELNDEVPPIWADRNKLMQVFVNLLTNAIHAMPLGGDLTVRTYARMLQPEEVSRDPGSRLARQFRAGDTVAVAEILDTGSGIPEEMISKVFDPFFTTKPTGKGTGLGLAVTRKIVELHHGTIEVRNRNQGGVIVTVTFKV
jgi:PAS domain S-box-containing protein